MSDRLAPMRVICTTVVRGADSYDLSGRILDVELPSGKVVHSLHLPSGGFIAGPRGGSRGGRGVQVYDGRIYVALYNRIMVYDLGWRVVSEIWNPLVVGHHEILVDKGGIWCCGTATDAVFRLDFSGKILFQWWASEEGALVEWLGIKGHAWDKTRDYTAAPLPSPEYEGLPGQQLHINTVSAHGQEILAYDSNHSALFSVAPRFAPIARCSDWDHAHNVQCCEEGIIVNNSARKAFELWSYRRGLGCLFRRRLRRIRSLCVGESRDVCTQFGRPGWTRGLVILSPRQHLVGSSPARLVLVEDWRMKMTWSLSEDTNETIHGLALCSSSSS